MRPRDQPAERRRQGWKRATETAIGQLGAPPQCVRSLVLRDLLPRPLASRAFRLQWPADLMTSVALEMEVILLGWYVLVETRSVLLLTVYGAVHLPGVLLAPVYGAFADRIGHARLLTLMRTAYACCAATTLTLAACGMLTPLPLFAVAAVMGLVRPSDVGIRAALVTYTVPAGDLVSAMGLARTTSDVARAAGALAGASIFAAFGMATAYLVVVCLYAGGALLTAAVGRCLPGPAAPGPQAASRRPSLLADLVAGLAYIWRTPELLAVIWVAVLINLTAFPFSNGLLPYVSREIYHSGQAGLGLLAASFAVGALAGSLVMSAVADRARQSLVMLASAAGWYVLLLVLAVTQSFAPGAVLLALAGAMQSFCLVSIAVLLMRTSAPAMRGRVMGVRILATGTLPTGLVIAGALIARIGFRETILLYAVLGLLLTAAIAVKWRGCLLGSSRTDDCSR